MEKSNEYMMFCPKCANLVYPECCKGPLCVDCGSMMMQSKSLRVIDFPLTNAYTPPDEEKRITAQNRQLEREHFEREILPLGQFDMSLDSAQFNYRYIYEMPQKPSFYEDTPTPKPDVPKCPICGSTKLKKISTANKVGSVVLFGLFAAGHVSKTWKCENCGSKF